MQEIPRVTQSGHNLYEDIAKTVEYTDGSVNVEIDKVATSIDLNASYNKHLDLNNPASFIGITTVDYNGNKTVYVLTDGGCGDSVKLTYPLEGAAEFAAGTLFPDEWVNSLKKAPLTIGARHRRFNDEKLLSVAGLRSVDGSVDGSNPLAVAAKILAQRATE
jgi:hypothetical protein